jgi:hypothetical protein
MISKKLIIQINNKVKLDLDLTNKFPDIFVKRKFIISKIILKNQYTNTSVLVLEGIGSIILDTILSIEDVKHIYGIYMFNEKLANMMITTNLTDLCLEIYKDYFISYIEELFSTDEIFKDIISDEDL